ncbi:hypothetical protein Ddye_014207 [Dipteronia dyeriana]|uniref:RNA helicase n=1 Tax=Dipteronia dyeriana TaxID=168575 RepID=A0AAD9X7Z2_9ROSI|nr:hypothetical protein Ddye_014207 [Dipteronia dyeriana]
MEEETLIDENFPLFGKSKRKSKPIEPQNTDFSCVLETAQLEKFSGSSDTNSSSAASFADIGLAEWAVQTCKELGMKRPTAVQSHCIPKILEGRDVLGLAQTGSGKTAAFALPILQRLAEDPYGVLALVVTPTRELAFQLAEQFRALGSCLHLRCEVVVGGMDKLSQARNLVGRPHVVIATPGRIKVLLEEDPDISPVFSKTKFLVLDEADRVLDAGFEDELRVVFQCLPKSRQTLLFSATMTSDLQTLLELSSNKAYFYKAYEGFKTVDTLKQKFIKMPKKVKDVYLVYMLSKMEDMGIRSAIIFVSTCRNPRDYVHRVGRTARAGRGGLSVSFVSQNDVVLLHAIEADLGKQLEEFECKEQDVLSDITRIFNASRVAKMKLMDEGFDEKAKERKKQKMKTLSEKGLLKKRNKKRKIYVE